MFSIVQFSDGLALVCTEWLRGDYCSYPPYLSHTRVNLAVQSMETPGPKWREYKVLRKFGNADSFEQGQLKVSKAMELSEIDTDCDRNSDRIVESSPRKKSPLKKKKKTFDYLDEESRRVPSSTPKSSGLPPLPRLNVELDQSQGSSVQDVEAGDKKISNFLLDFRNHVYYKLNKISHRLTAIEERLSANEKAVAQSKVCPLEECFPINSFEGLMEIEHKLLDVDYHTKLVHSFKSFGGKDFYGVTSTILKKLVTDDVAELYSWSGQKKKMAFKDLLVVKVVLDAVRAHRPAVTETEVAEVIAKWLVQARQRLNRATMKQVKNGAVIE